MYKKVTDTSIYYYQIIIDTVTHVYETDNKIIKSKKTIL